MAWASAGVGPCEAAQVLPALRMLANRGQVLPLRDCWPQEGSGTTGRGHLMKVALYARKSKGNPSKVQLDRLRTVALAEGHEIVLERQDVATGKNPNRPGWEDITQAVKGG